jgi:PAS domain-containing protein
VEGNVRGFFIVLADQHRGEKLARAKSAIDHAEERIAAALAGLSLDTEVEAIASNLREAQASLADLRSLERASRIGASHSVNLADVVSSMEESVIAVDLELRVQVWSHGAEEMYGWRAAETIRQADLLVHPAGVGSGRH